MAKPLHAGKIILGPMVRVGTLPMRLLALEYGADLVYTEEIIDFKLIKSRRLVNDILDTIDYVDESGVIIFRTCHLERDKVILQIGTNDPNRAVLAAKKVQNDVAGIDINMGCPKSFSLKGGMGAALMTQPETVRRILTALKSSIDKPISCKVRVFDDIQSTLDFLKLIQDSGADAVAIHGRTKSERPQHSNRNDYIRAASEFLTIPVIANGDSSKIHCLEDLWRFRTETKASSVMVARAAMKNCSIFSRERSMDVESIIKKYLKLAIKYDNNAINTKYCIQQMLGSLQEVGRGKRILGTYDLRGMSDIYGLSEFHDENENEWIRRKRKRNQSNEDENHGDDDDLIQLPVIFDRTLFIDSPYPKSILNKWIVKNQLDDCGMPEYDTRQIEKQFHSVLRFMGKRYSTPYLEKNKRSAEQAAALVLIFKFGICDDRKILETCLIGQDNSMDCLECWHNGQRYLIKVNK